MPIKVRIMHRIWRRVILSLFFFSLVLSDLEAQVHVVSVTPDSTDMAIRTIHGNHFAYTNASVVPKHRLVFMIEGTGSAAQDLFSFDSSIAALGYAVISLDYPDNVITTTCSNSTDSGCFDSFRQEIVFGTPVSPIVDVDSSNCLYHRLLAFLQYLVRRVPGQGWDEYIEGDRIQWEKIIAAGHSQGAGHAAYLGKHFPLAKVMIFSGPQDYLGFFHTPAGWLSEKSRTAPSRYYAFLHIRDPYDFNKQLANCKVLMGSADTLMVSPEMAVPAGSGLSAGKRRHILVTNIETKNPHGSTLDPLFRQVLKYMLADE
jgi:hypothetical protein